MHHGIDGCRGCGVQTYFVQASVCGAHFRVSIRLYLYMCILCVTEVCMHGCVCMGAGGGAVPAEGWREMRGGGRGGCSNGCGAGQGMRGCPGRRQ